MEDRKSRLKEFLEWAHHAYWIHELIVSLGITGAVMGWVRHHLAIPLYLLISLSMIMLGVMMYMLTPLRKLLSHRKQSPESSETTEIIQDVMWHGARAALYDYMACRAHDLIRDLDFLWHHWDDAGEKLIHPLDGKIDKLRNSTDTTWKLIDERRDFMHLYAHHMMTMGVTLSDFTSNAVTGGYPSDREYVVVRADLVEHASELEKMAKKTWGKYGQPIDER